jgi:hypothetical protein
MRGEAASYKHGEIIRMMLGSSDPAPYDTLAIVALACLGLVLLAGVVTGHYWSLHLANFARRAAVLLAVVVVAVLLFVTPTRSGAVGAGRLLTLWPAVGIDLLLYLLWTWRAGRL